MAEYGSLKFTQAIEFFRNKVDVPTERWADLWRDQHNLAFTVAGATKQDLLTDMRKLVDDLKELHDYVIIDCPAGIENGFRNSIAGADRALIVTTPEVSAIRDADRIIGLVEANDLPEPELILNDKTQNIFMKPFSLPAFRMTA